MSPLAWVLLVALLCLGRDTLKCDVYGNWRRACAACWYLRAFTITMLTIIAVQAF